MKHNGTIITHYHETFDDAVNDLLDWADGIEELGYTIGWCPRCRSPAMLINDDSGSFILCFKETELTQEDK